MLDAQRSPVPLPHEMTISNVGSGVELILTIPNTAPAGSAPAGGLSGPKRLKATGKVWLTDVRVCFPDDAVFALLTGVERYVHSTLL